MTARVLRTMAALLLVVTSAGCATKKDVRTLREDLMRMQQREEELLLQLREQNRLLLDSIRTTMAMTVDVRGTTANSFREFDRNVTELGELVGQIMGTLQRIDQRLTVLEQRPAAAAAPGGTISGGGMAEQYYTTGTQLLRDGSHTAARMAFEQLLTEFPQHARAADAQFQLGEVAYQQQRFDDAYAAMRAVAERWPQSPRAPAALFRAGAMAEERKDVPKAREFYQSVREKYPQSDEARQAQQRLSALPRR